MEKMNLFGDQVSNDIIGIDLGTTNSAVAVYNAGTVPTLLPIGENGKYTIPSCVRWDGYDENDQPIFTVGAEAYSVRYQPNVIYSIKRLMGSGEKVSFTSVEEERISASETKRKFLSTTPAYVSSIILKYMKDKVAEFYRPVDKCVITVPAYFNQRQIEDTLEAAKLAGLDCKQILKEPTSASYIYSQLGHAANGTVLIYDLGGGTFDVTHMNFLRRDAVPSKLLTSLKRQYGIVLENGNGLDATDQYFCRVLGTYGDINLGGDDIDKELGDYLIKKYNVEVNDEDKERIYLKCEEFKKSGIYGLDFTIGDNKIHITSEDLDVAVDKIFARTLRIMEDIDMSNVGTIVLVGGSTKSQRIRDNLSKAFPGVEISAVLDPDATVALGAGSVAKAIASNSDLMYADVLPLPIGVLVDEKRVDVCIPRNTSMPHTVSKQYHTIHDNQTQITVHVYQGLSSLPAECTYLGRLTLTDIPKAPAGEVDVQVSFVLTGQGRLRILSRIEGIDKEESLVIDNIFDVKDDGPTRTNPAEDSGDGLFDDFERNFMPLAEGKEEIIQLFADRRKLAEAASTEEERLASLQVYEDIIVGKLM